MNWKAESWHSYCDQVPYLARTNNGVWAGWFLNDGRSPLPFSGDAAPLLLGPLLEAPTDDNDRRAGVFSCNGLWLDETDARTPFRDQGIAPKATVAAPISSAHASTPRSEESEEAISALFDGDLSAPKTPPAYSVARVRKRNTRAAAALKRLYNNTCQITGTDYLFKKRDGTYYVEAHHLIPLGDGGADDPRNMVVVSPQLHKMLHHAKVGPIDLSKMEKTSDGTWFLDITINDSTYTIRWHSTHAELMQRFDE